MTGEVTGRKPARYRNVKRFTDRHGKVRTYFRRGKAPMVRLPNDTGSAEFREAYQKAVEGIRSPYVYQPMRTKSGEKGPTVGVYLLMLNGEIVYVGSSLRMPVRVAAHRANGRPFDRAFYIATKQDERLALETLLIGLLRPVQNRAGNNGYVSRDREPEEQPSNAQSSTPGNFGVELSSESPTKS